MKKLLPIFLLFIAVSTASFGQGVWKNQLALEAGLDFPTGNASNTLGMGYGVTGTYYYQLFSRNTFVSLSVGYISFPYNNTLGITGSTSTIPVLLGIRHNFALTGFQPYIGAEAGLYLRSNSDNTASTTDFGIMPKVGFRLPIQPQLDFDGNVKINMVLSDPAFTFIGLNVGIAYTLL